MCSTMRRQKRAHCFTFFSTKHICDAPTHSFHQNLFLVKLVTVAQRSSSHDSREPQRQPKKYRRTAVHSQGERVLDVDTMSSDGCPVHMLSEGEYNIHSSN